MFFLGLITKCKDEFCDYYLSKGVNKIFIIDDNKVEIIYEKSIFNFIKLAYNQYIIQEDFLINVID